MLSTSLDKKRRRKRQRKMPANTTGQKTPHVTKKMAFSNTAEVTLTLTDVQRQNRQATQKWKVKARKFAFSLAVGLHAIAIVAFGIWFIKKTVLQMNEDKVEGIVVQESQPQNKRAITPRKVQKAVKPKAVKVLAPQRTTVVTSANLKASPTDFTIPMAEILTETPKEFMAMGYETNMKVQSRQIEIVSTVPKFEMPKFENTALSMNMDMGNSLAVMDFDVSENLGLAATDFGETKQSFSEFLRLVRERIKEFQRFPPSVRNLEEGSTATIRFTLYKDGTIRDPMVLNSSGSRVLDNAALSAVQNAEPYPPFPDSQLANIIRLELPIIFQQLN